MRSRVLVVLAAMTALASTSLAQYHVTVGSSPQTVTVYDPVANKTILDTTGSSLYDAHTIAMSPTSITITPSVTNAGVSPNLCDGFDVEYVFDNTGGGSAQYVGELLIPGCVFGTTGGGNDVVRSRKFRWDCTGQAVDFDATTNGYYFTNEQVYPDGLFSPLMFLHSGNYGIGVSVIYPLIDPAGTYGTTSNQYNHPVYTNTWGVGGVGNHKTWFFTTVVSGRLFAGSLSQGSGDTRGMVPAGQSRTYKLAVRVKNLGSAPTVSNANSSPLVEGTQDWLEVFKPYKQYFDGRYRGNNYRMKSCPDPVLAVSVGYPGGTNGFVGIPPSYTQRVDTHGFQPFKTFLENEEANGWTRRMVWSPSGCFNTQSVTSCWDFPYQFISGWDRFSPGLGSSDDIRVLQPLADNTQTSGVGEDLGMWWGHSSTIMTAWPPTNPGTDVYAFNPTNSGQASTWNTELGRAITDSTGPKADMVGLDAYGMSDSSSCSSSTATAFYDRSYHWMRAVTNAHPNIGFIQESMPFDVCATLSAGYIDHYKIKSPHYLVQLLVPGNEIWGSVEHQHTTPSDTTLNYIANAETFASWGFTPVCFTYGTDITGASMSARVPAVVPCSMLVPTIYTDLPNSDIFTGRSNDSLTVDVSSPGANVFTWQKNTGGGWATVADANAVADHNTLSFTNVVASNTGDYRLKIEYGGGNCTSAVVYSNTVTVQVCSPKDYNGDSVAGDQDDIDDFFACLGGTCCGTCWGADINSDGETGTDADVEAFFRIMDDEPC